MPVIAVANRKGGSGKSTLSTNIAAWCAQSGWQVMLGDIDRQQSVRTWLQRRPEEAPPITTWAIDNGKVFRAPRGTTHVVLDTPGALYDYEQSKLLIWLDAIVVPIGPSLFDREASLTFLAELRRHPRVSSGKCKVAVIGMRWPLEALERWKRGEGTWEQSLLTVIPEDPRYRAFLDNGSSVFDDFGSRTPQDMANWAPLLQWLDNVWTEVRTPLDQTTVHSRQAGQPVRPVATEKPTVSSHALQTGLRSGRASTNEAVEQVTEQAVDTPEHYIPAYLLRSVTHDEAAESVVASAAEATKQDVDTQPQIVPASVVPAAPHAHAPIVQSGAEDACIKAAAHADRQQARMEVQSSAALKQQAVDDVPPPQKDKGWLARWLKLA